MFPLTLKTISNRIAIWQYEYVSFLKQVEWQSANQIYILRHIISKVHQLNV